MTSKELSWKPKRDGDIYCAPACGGGCTYTKFQLASTRAAALCERLGPGWREHVFENLGWHYKVKSLCGRIHVHEYWRTDKKPGLIERIARMVPDHYTVFLNLDGGDGGQWTASADTPEEAIHLALAQAIDQRDAINEMLAGVDNLIVALKPD